MKIISLHEAKIAGLIRYYTGVPCIHGHDSERLVSERSCIRCMLVRKKRRRPSRRRELRESQRNKLRAIAYLGGKCKDCGWYGHPAGFEFDHVEGRGKRPHISLILGNGNTWVAILRHLNDGIDLVCAVCHNIRSYERGRFSGKITFGDD